MDVTVDQTSTLRSQAGGHPPLICLNDQGGSVMSCTEDIAETLRAQEHGHQPLIFENHGIDGRYTGPHDIAPTLSARAGTGGNNLPIALQGGDWCETAFARQRADSFKESKMASTESARQHKDATDLVLQPDDNDPAILLIRRLTPRECELLQGFPPDWTDLPGASDSARYNRSGTAFPSHVWSILCRGSRWPCGRGFRICWFCFVSWHFFVGFGDSFAPELPIYLPCKSEKGAVQHGKNGQFMCAGTGISPGTDTGGAGKVWAVEGRLHYAITIKLL